MMIEDKIVVTEDDVRRWAAQHNCLLITSEALLSRNVLADYMYRIDRMAKELEDLIDQARKYVSCRMGPKDVS